MKIIRGMYVVISDIVSLPFVVLGILIALVFGCVESVQYKNLKYLMSNVCDYVSIVRLTLFCQWNWVKTGLWFIITD